MLEHIQLLMQYHLVSSSISWYLIISVHYLDVIYNDTVLFCLVHAMLGFGFGNGVKTVIKFLYRYIWVIELQCIFFLFFLKLILNVIAIIRIKLWRLIFILAIPKSPILFTILSLKQLILKLYHW